MYDLLITNGSVVTMDGSGRVFNPGAVAVTGDSIAAVGPAGDFLGAEAERTIDARGKAVFPGLVNTHTHLFQSLLKGLGDDRVLADWLATATLPSAREFRALESYTAGMLGCLDALHSGTTTILDYNYAHPVPGLADEFVKAFRQLGIRAILARGASDGGEQFGVPPGLRQSSKDILADFVRLHETYHRAGNDRLRVWVAPGSVWGCTPAHLKEVARVARELGTGLTVHISETKWDREATESVYGGRSDAQVLEDYGIVGPDILMVHCVYLTPEEIAAASRHGTRISLNTVSNMYLASGAAPIPAMLEAGLTLSIGTDGAASNNTQDMIESLKATALLAKVTTTDPTAVTSRQVLEMATIGGARAIGMDGIIGSLEPGKRADLFIFDPARSPKAVPMFDPISTLVYSGGVANVDTVIVDGRVLIEDGRVTTIDEKAFLARAQKVAEDLAERAGTLKLAQGRVTPS